MSLELRGFYSALLDAQWEYQGQIPKDEKWVALACQCSTRMVRSLLPKLIAAGKIIETENGYYNRRMMADILGLEDVKPSGEFAPVSRSIQAPVAAHSSATRTRVEHESSTKNQKNPVITTRVLETDTETEEKIKKEIAAQQVDGVARKAGRRFEPAIDLKTLSDRVTDACNGALASQATAPGLASMSIPLMWIEHGADLERDVIPTLTAAGKRYHGKGIRTWDYFTPMIAEAKAKRLAGLPAVDANRFQMASPPSARAVLAGMKFQ